ncbi:hypothetical protein KI387_040302, partial [Taxus chinensis]
ISSSHRNEAPQGHAVLEHPHSISPQRGETDMYSGSLYQVLVVSLLAGAAGGGPPMVVPCVPDSDV